MEVPERLPQRIFTSPTWPVPASPLDGFPQTPGPFGVAAPSSGRFFCALTTVSAPEGMAFLHCYPDSATLHPGLQRFRSYGAIDFAVTPVWGFSAVRAFEQIIGMIGAVARRGSGVRVRTVRWELCHVLIFSFFFIKKKEHKEINDGGS